MNNLKTCISLNQHLTLGPPSDATIRTARPEPVSGVGLDNAV